jgi:OFA family oxalate/formate antiporter-like MFS transporter
MSPASSDGIIDQLVARAEPRLLRCACGELPLTMDRPKGERWTIAIAAIVMQFALGTIYAWSVFRNPLMERFHWTIAEVTRTFTIALLTIGFGAYIGGEWTARKGPRVVVMTAGLFYGGGLLVASFADHGIAFLYGGHGLLAGAGIGLGYIVPVSTLVRWFPDRRGLVIGAAMAGFGAGALFTSPIAATLIKNIGVLTTFRVLGIGYAIAVVGCGLVIRNPPPALDVSSRASVPSIASIPPPGVVERRQQPRGPRAYTLRAALRTWQWYALWVLLFLNVMSGISILSQAAPMAEEITGATAMGAAGLVGMLAIANTLGRFLWASLSDWLGRRWVFAVMFVLQAVALFVLPSVTDFALFTSLCAVVLFCCGGGFGTMPAFVADYFGSPNVGAVYGFMLTAWGFAGWLGPTVIVSLRERTGGYGPGLRVLGIITLCATGLPLLGRRPARRMSLPPPVPRR